MFLKVQVVQVLTSAKSIFESFCAFLSVPLLVFLSNMTLLYFKTLYFKTHFIFQIICLCFLLQSPSLFFSQNIPLSSEVISSTQECQNQLLSSSSILLPRFIRSTDGLFWPFLFFFSFSFLIYFDFSSMHYFLDLQTPLLF